MEASPTRSSRLAAPRRTDRPSSWATLPVGTLALGLVGTITVVIGGALAGAVAPESSGRFWSVPTVPVRPGIDLVPALALFYGGLIVLVRAWLRLRRKTLADGLRPAVVVIVAAVWAIPLLIGPPLGSRDVYAYAAQGRMAAVGLDVYDEGPAALGDDPVLDPVDPLYLDAPVVYGPVFVALSSEVSERTGGGIIATVLAFRALAVLGLAVATFAVWDLTRGLGRDPADAMVLTVANPLVLLHLVSGAHNEALMLAFLVGGVAVGRRPRWRWLGIALCAFAAVIKLPAVLGAVFVAWSWIVAGDRLRSRVLRLLLAGGWAMTVITLATRFTGWGWGWVDAILNASRVDAYLSITRVLGGAVHLVTGFDSSAVLDAASLIGVALAAVLTLVLLLVRGESAPASLGLALLAVAVLHPTTQPWYLTWGLLLLAAATAGERNRLLVATCAAAAFVVLPVGPQLGAVLLEGSGTVSMVVALSLLAVLTFSPLSARNPRIRRTLDVDTVSIVVPTRNEEAAVGLLIDRIVGATRSLRGKGRRIEVVIVDDSSDETPRRVRELAETTTEVDVRLLHRLPDQRWGGLGGAVVEGFGVVRGSTAVVIDADLQHPPEVVPRLLDRLDAGGLDLVVASRRVPGGSDGTGLSPSRRAVSVLLSGFVRLLFPRAVRPVNDPLSGFFAVRVGALDLARLRPDGFKILLEVLATHRSLDVDEVPYRFEDRAAGASNASLEQGARFAAHVTELRVRTAPPWSGAPIKAREVFEPV